MRFGSAVAAETGYNDAPPTTPKLTAALEEQSGCLSYLSETLAVLEKRLSLITTPPQPQPTATQGNQKEGIPGISAVTHHVMQNTYQTRQLAARLEYLLQNLEYLLQNLEV